MTKSTLASAIAAAAGDDAPEHNDAPETPAPAEPAPPAEAPAEPAAEPAATTLAGVIGMDAATAFAMTALAFPARAELYNALGAVAAKGDPAKFQAALVAARDGDKGPAVSTAQNTQAVSKTGGTGPVIDRAKIDAKFNPRPAA